jgi:hypothetical protein
MGSTGRCFNLQKKLIPHRQNRVWTTKYLYFFVGGWPRNRDGLAGTSFMCIAEKSSATAKAPTEQLLGCFCGFSLPSVACRAGYIRNDEEQQQYQRHERRWAIFRKIMRNKCRDSRKRESGIGPLFEFGHARYKKCDGAKRFGDPQNDAELLRVPDVRKSLNRLRTSR